MTGTHCAAPEVHRWSFLLHRARCKHIVCTHNTAADAAQPCPLSEWTSASGDKSFGRDVFSRDARRRHHLMCILAAEPNYYRCTRPTLFVLQLQGLGTGSGEHLVVGIQLYDRLRFCAGHKCPDSSGLGNSNCGAAHTRKQQPQKTCRGS